MSHQPGDPASRKNTDPSQVVNDGKGHRALHKNVFLHKPLIMAKCEEGEGWVMRVKE